jgi:hypothetical protein
VRGERGVPEIFCCGILKGELGALGQPLLVENYVPLKKEKRKETKIMPKIYYVRIMQFRWAYF